MGDSGLSTRALAVTLGVLAATRALLCIPASMWAWGIDLLKWVSPYLGGITWGLSVGSLVLPVGRALEQPLERLGEKLERSRAARRTAAVLVAALVWSQADRVWFLGDFMLRQGAIEGGRMAGMFQQSMPLDVLLHGGLLPIFSFGAAWLANPFARILGAVEAAMLAVLALRFARELGLAGAAALAAAAVVFFGGHLALFTGFSKTAGELCLLTVAAAVFGIRMAREGRGEMAMALVVSVAFGLHRSGLALLPVWLLVWVIWFRRHHARRRLAAWFWLLFPVLALVWVAPRIVTILRGFDLGRHVLTPEVASTGGVLAAAFAPLRLLDLANLALLLAPLSPVLIVWLIAARGRVLPRIEVQVLGAILLGWLPLLALIHPQQGIFRDWDVFAPAGTALAMLTACALGDVLRRPGASWLAAAVIAGGAAPAIQTLAMHHDQTRGLARARAFATQAPVRTDAQRAMTWDFVGGREFRLRRWDQAAEAYARAAEDQPTRRMFLGWALAEMLRGDLEKAERLYLRLLEMNDQDPIAWLGLAGVAARLGNTEQLAIASARLRSYRVGSTEAQEIQLYLTFYPQVWPEGAKLPEFTR